MDHQVHAKLLEAVKAYHTPPSAIELLNANPPLVVAGITASGKETVVKHVEKISGYRHVITHTTRHPREGENSGEDYWFVSEEEMVRLMEVGSFVETTAIHGETIYGTSIEAYEKATQAGHQPLLIMDVQGIAKLKPQMLKLQPVFLLPPSFEVWMERLDKRGHMSHVERIARLRSARTELETALSVGYYKLVVNKEVALTASEILRFTSEPNIQRQNRELAQLLTDNIRHY